MRIITVEIENFRGIRKEKINFDQLTAFVGRNGAGKSTVLHALNYFYDVGLSVTENDFFNKDKNNEISIAVTFGELSSNERSEFSSYLSGVNLKVVKVFTSGITNGTYHGFSKQIPEFADVRTIQGKREISQKYKELKETKFKDLPTATSADAALAEMSRYEITHPEQCVERPRTDQFFGPRNIGGGKLDNYTKYLLIPAVRDAMDEANDRDGVISTLINNFVQSRIEKRDDVVKFKQEFEQRAKEIYSDTNLTELPQLSDGINTVLDEYAPGAKLNLQWGVPTVPVIRLPEVLKRLSDDGFETSIGNMGHGLQRSLIISLLQFIETFDGWDEKTSEKSDEPMPAQAPETSSPGLILAIEEPELYQHPSRCKYLSGLLQRLSAKQADAMQVMYVTHSPYFVDMNRFSEVRVVGKMICADINGMKEGKIKHCDLGTASQRLAAACGKPGDQAYTAESFIARATPIMTVAVNEGFFANAVFLVEGETETGLFPELGNLMKLDFERLGIVVINVVGKSKLDRPVIIFESLGVKVFWLFDGDKTKQKEGGTNLLLQRLGGIAAPQEWPSTNVTDHFGVFEEQIEHYLQSKAGDKFAEILEAAKSAAKYKGDTALKKAEVAKQFVRIAYGKGLKFPELEEMIRRVVKKIS